MHMLPPWLCWPLWNICVTNDHGYVPLVVNTSRSFPHSRLITGFVTRLTRRVPLVEQELLTLPEHLSSPPVFSGVRVTRCFVDRCLSFCTCSFDHCVVCFSSIYGFWLPLWYLQALLTLFNFSLDRFDCICVLGVSIWSLSTILIFNFGISISIICRTISLQVVSDLWQIRP